MSRVRAILTRLLLTPVTLAALVIGFLIAAPYLEAGTVQILTFALIAVIFAQSLNVLTGLAGQISLGHAGFFGIGAYGTAILSKSHGISLLLSIPAGAVMAGVVGYLLSFPAGRVRDVYLAMMTVGFGLIFYEVVREWRDLTGGTMGLPGVASAALRTLVVFGVRLDEVDYFRIVLVATVLVLWLLRNFAQSRTGRSLMTIHHNEMAAGSLGISRSATKRLAYGVSGLVAGTAGAFYAHLVGYLGPESFGLTRSIEVLVIAIVGGLGSIAGQVVSAVLFTFLPELLQTFAEYQFIVYGLILTFALLVLPRGLASVLFESPRYIRSGALKIARSGRAPPAASTLPEFTGRATITIENLSKSFDGLVALDDVSLTLEPGHITALVGPNGSGKSTLVNVVSGIYRPSGGRVRLGDRDITGMPDHQIAREGIIRTFQDPRLVPQFTVRENLLLGSHRLARRSGLAATVQLPSAVREEAAFLREVEAAMEETGIAHLADTTIDQLPYGYCRLVEVVRALLAKPHTILLDEPAAGLSDVEIGALSELIRGMKASGLTILLIDHRMDFLAELVDSTVVLDSGQVIFRGSMEEMRKDPEVIRAYLGQDQPPAEEVRARA
ncbi:ABC transporter permease subunit [Acuticoccus sp.]|uniref:branched-chain amino acid ABC transporter ATP-binding protein/permease n=1 Tax=Acuticoccus sp. TaxID=1904378 RepID=UPI003B51D17F